MVSFLSVSVRSSFLQDKKHKERNTIKNRIGMIRCLITIKAVVNLIKDSM